MNISIKAVALVAALSTISFAAPVAAQEPLREGEVREETCASHPGFGYASRVVRGVRAQRQDGTWFVGPQVITFRYSMCQRPQSQNLVSLPGLDTISEGPRSEPITACRSDGLVVMVGRSGTRHETELPCVIASA